MKRILIMLILAVAIPVNIIAQNYELNRAKRLIENEEYKEAATLLRPLAENGNAEAQYLAAGLFVEGKGVIKSEKQAEKYYILAFNGGYKQAIIGLVELYDKIGEKEKASDLLIKLCSNNHDIEKSPLAHIYGEYLYHGYGNISVNKQRGWGIMYRSGNNVKHLKDDFYTSLINEYKDNPEGLLYLLCDYYWSNSNTKIGWTANYLDDVVSVIKTEEKEKQTEYLRVCDSMYVHGKYTAAAIISSIMYAEGIGVENKQIIKAKNLYSEAVDDEMYKLLYFNLYQHADNGNNGHLNRGELPNFWSIVYEDYLERKERWDFVNKRNNVKLCQTGNVVKLKSCKAYMVDGELTVAFEILNTSPNPTGRLTYAKNPRYQYNGKYKEKGSIKYYLSREYGIKGHSTETFYLKIKEDMPKSGEFDFVEFTLSCDYGNVIIRAENVVWNDNVKL